jgi:DNA invertase Pin-like site-specific DNA recombinase
MGQPHGGFFDSCGPFRDAVIAIIGTVAKLERVKIDERTKAGLARVKGRGSRLGRPRGSASADMLLALHRAEPGVSGRAIAPRTGISLGIIQRTFKAPAA